VAPVAQDPAPVAPIPPTSVAVGPPPPTSATCEAALVTVRYLGFHRVWQVREVTVAFQVYHSSEPCHLSAWGGVQLCWCLVMRRAPTAASSNTYHSVQKSLLAPPIKQHACHPKQCMTLSCCIASAIVPHRAPGRCLTAWTCGCLMSGLRHRWGADGRRQQGHSSSAVFQQKSARCSHSQSFVTVPLITAT
jgi:hypothetical protein